MINHWIAAILLFNFKLVHIPAEKHHGPDGLSQHEPANSKDNNEDDPKEWIDRTLMLGVWVVSWLEAMLTNNSTTTWTLETHNKPPPQCSAHLHTKTHPNHLKSIDMSNSSQHSNSLECSVDKLPSLAGDNNEDLTSTQHLNPWKLSADNLPPLANDNTLNNHNNSSPEHSANNLLVDTDTANHNSTPANDDNNASHSSPFPPNMKAAKVEDELLLVHEYLRCPHPPSHLHSDTLTHFLRRVAHFTLASDQLWQIQGNGQHQLYITPTLHLSLVHDGLGHKGFYSTQCTIANRFWWPLLNSDIKWYVETCHQCQLHQMTQV